MIKPTVHGSCPPQRLGKVMFTKLPKLTCVGGGGGACVIDGKGEGDCPFIEVAEKNKDKKKNAIEVKKIAFFIINFSLTQYNLD